MEMSDFRNFIISEINAASSDENDRRDAFISEVVEALTDSSQCNGFTPCLYKGTGKNNKIIEVDGYEIDEFDSTLSVFICKYSGNDIANTLTKTEIEKLYNKAKYFVQGAFDDTIFSELEPNSASYYAAMNIHEYRENIQRFRFFIISDDVLSERVIKNLDYEFIDGKITQLSIWDIGNYQELVSAKKTSQDAEVIFENYGYDGISCIKANEVCAGADYDAYLCVLPGKLLSDIYSEFGSQLLESNVRSYLTAKGKVNKGIKKTIQNQPDRFFAYNNGLTTTASEIDVVNSERGPIMTRIKSLQIVNGGQTTASISAAVRDSKNPSDIDKIYVPMKICLIHAEDPDEFTRNISQYSNFQNKVSNADFFSNSPFHKKFEQMSRRLNAPATRGSIYSTKWYYERARGSYIQETSGLKPSEIKDFQRNNPKKQIITKTDLAKYRCAFEMLPFVVSKGPQTCIVKFGEIMDALWSSTENSVAGSKVNDNYFKDTVAMAIVYKELEKSVFDKNLSPWYIGYRQNIVAYAISKLVHMLAQKNASLNYNKIWNEQDISIELRDQLLVISERINTIINDPDRPYPIVTEYCKREICWKKVMESKIDLSPNAGIFAISERKQNYTSRIANRDETQTQQINAKIDVVNKGDEFWSKVLAWGAENGLLNKDEREVISVAANAHYRNKPPSDKQSAWIMRIYKRLCDEGFE